MALKKYNVILHVVVLNLSCVVHNIPSATFRMMLLSLGNMVFHNCQQYFFEMMENEAPESRKSSSGWLSVVTLVWLPNILSAVEGFLSAGSLTSLESCKNGVSAIVL